MTKKKPLPPYLETVEDQQLKYYQAMLKNPPTMQDIEAKAARERRRQIVKTVTVTAIYFAKNYDGTAALFLTGRGVNVWDTRLGILNGQYPAHTVNFLDRNLLQDEDSSFPPFTQLAVKFLKDPTPLNFLAMWNASWYFPNGVNVGLNADGNIVEVKACDL